MKRIIAYISAGLLLGITLQQCIDYYTDAELTFFNSVANKTDQWHKTAKLSRLPIHIIVGGSEVATSVDPAAMQKEHGIIVVNAGNHAGFGILGNMAAIEHYITEGTHIICSIYPTVDITAQGIKFAFRRRGFNLFKSEIIPTTDSNLLTLLTGDLTSNVDYLKRTRSEYKYTHVYADPQFAITHSNGFLEIIYDGMSKSSVAKKAQISQDIDDLTTVCKKLQSICNEKNASFSVLLTLHHNTADIRKQHAKLARHLTISGIPVIKDSRLGISDDISDFADTPSHLSRKGIDSCTSIWGDAIKNKRYWTVDELDEHIGTTNTK